jgi:hypothetical protein
VPGVSPEQPAPGDAPATAAGFLNQPAHDTKH